MDNNGDQFDAYSIFQTRRPLTSKEEAWHREMERRSYDIIRVKNAGDQDYFVEWDKRYHRVPAHAHADLPRYVAVKYCRDMATDIINTMNDKLHTEDLLKREKAGLPRFDNKYDENKATYDTARYPRTNDRELLTTIYNDLWVGLVYEFGKDSPATSASNARSGEVELTPIEVTLLKKLDSRKVDLVESPEVTPEPIFPTIVEPLVPPINGKSKSK